MQQYLQIFEDEKHMRIRTLNIGGNIWFVAADVCGALAIGNTSAAVSALDDDQKDIISNDTPGGNQKMVIVSESGIYELVFKSRTPEEEVLRDIQTL